MQRRAGFDEHFPVAADVPESEHLSCRSRVLHHLLEELGDREDAAAC